jgi:hypothetical protein
MSPHKSYRVPKARTVWEQKWTLLAAKYSRITKKTAHTGKKTALKPVATGPLQKQLNSTPTTFQSFLRTTRHSIGNSKLRKRLLHWEQFPNRGYCVWCTKQAQTSKTSAVLAEIVNGAAPTGRKPSTRSQGDSTSCTVYL